MAKAKMHVSKISHDSETSADGEQVITACAFIHKNLDGIEKVFLPKRAATKKFLPNVHELPGGHIEFGEDIIIGLKREIMEEFGMGVKVGDPFNVFTYTNQIKGSHSIEVDFFATFTGSIDDIQIYPEDHSEYGWYGEDQIENEVTSLRNPDDPEIKAIHKAFFLLKTRKVDFGL